MNLSFIVIIFYIISSVFFAFNSIFEKVINENQGVVGLILTGAYIILGLPTDLILLVLSLITKLFILSRFV